jgi:charged multivesicular body protein 2A
MTPKEMMRKQDRAIKRAMRDLNKERNALEKNEKKMQIDLKKMAQKGQMAACKHIAKDVVRCRNQVTKTYRMQTQLQSIQNQITSMKATNASTEGMKQMLETMVMLNAQMELPALQQLAVDFGVENEKFEMQQELMEDAMDMCFADDEEMDEDTAAQEVLEKVLAGERLKAQEQFGALDPNAGATTSGPQRVAMMADGPSAPSGGAPGEPSGGDPGMDDLEARLAALRKQ